MFLETLMNEEKKFISSLDPKDKSFSVALLESFRLQFKLESKGKSYLFKNNAGRDDFADYGEFIASVVARFVGINVIKTHLTHNETEYGVLMDNFKDANKEYLNLSSILYSYNEIKLRTYDEVMAAIKCFCEDKDIICDESVGRDLKRLILLDFLLFQQDRHGRNIEFEISSNKMGDSVLKLAPIFDNEFCFLFMYDELVWDNYQYNTDAFLSRTFAFSKNDRVKSLAKEIIKSEDLTDILQKFIQIDINKIIDLCDEISSKKMPKKYRNLVEEIFESQKKKLCSEIKTLSIKKYYEGDDNEY